MILKNASFCAVTVPISVHYVHDLMHEVLSMDMICTHYVPKFVELVPMSALNTHPTMQVAKNVLMLVKNAPKFAITLAELTNSKSVYTSLT
jgi:hypothetical protein